jgi:hypothetical protein
MLRGLGRFNTLCLALLLILSILWIRSAFVEDRFVLARKPVSEAWIVVAEKYPWIDRTPKVISNIEFREFGIGAGRIWIAQARWAQREERVPDYDPYAPQAIAAKTYTPWGVSNAPGFYHIRGETRWIRGPIGSAHLGWSYGRESGQTWYSGDPGETWINDITEFRIPLWFVAAMLATPPMIHFARLLLRRKWEQGTCRACGYDLRASIERCPECGSMIIGN